MVVLTCLHESQTLNSEHVVVAQELAFYVDLGASLVHGLQLEAHSGVVELSDALVFDLVVEISEFDRVIDLLLLETEVSDSNEGHNTRDEEEDQCEQDLDERESNREEQKVADNDQEEHRNGEDAQVQLPWYVDFANAVNLLNGLSLLDLRIFDKGFDVEVDLASCLTLLLVFLLGTDTDCFRSDLAFSILSLVERVKSGREDDTVPSDAVIPHVGLV